MVTRTRRLSTPPRLWGRRSRDHPPSPYSRLRQATVRPPLQTPRNLTSST